MSVSSWIDSPPSTTVRICRSAPGGAASTTAPNADGDMFTKPAPPAAAASAISPATSIASNCAGAKTNRAPESNAAHTCFCVRSNVGDDPTTTASPARTPISAANQDTVLANPAIGTSTGLGRPVEPEVVMTYATRPGRLAARAVAADTAASTGATRCAPCARAVAGSSSMTSTPCTRPATCARVASSATSTPTTPAPDSTAPTRAAGCCGSTGKYAAPARQTPNNATTHSTERPIATPTTSSTPVPDRSNQLATARDACTSSA
ncbi:hypothetical protein SKPI104516_19625 [Skermania piniformis]